MTWNFAEGQKKHTQDGCQLVKLMKSIGHGRRPVVALDVGCGDGIITFDMVTGQKATSVYAFDLVPSCAKLASLNLMDFILEGKVQVDQISAAKVFRNKKHWDRFDRFVINPPFFASGSGQPNKNSLDQAARHEKTLSLKVWSKGAARLLKTGGDLYCVFPTERLGELLATLSRCGVEPKEVWWLKEDYRRRRFFLRAMKGARPGMIVHFDHKI